MVEMIHEKYIEKHELKGKSVRELRSFCCPFCPWDEYTWVNELQSRPKCGKSFDFLVTKSATNPQKHSWRKKNSNMENLQICQNIYKQKKTKEKRRNLENKNLSRKNLKMCFSWSSRRLEAWRGQVKSLSLFQLKMCHTSSSQLSSNHQQLNQGLCLFHIYF